MPKELSESGRKVLEACIDSDGYLFTNSGGLKGAPAGQVRKGLLAAGLIEKVERTAQIGDAFDGMSLRITDAGRTAIGAETAPPDSVSEHRLTLDEAVGPKLAAKVRKAKAPKAEAEAKAPRVTKTSQLVDLLRSKDGATITEAANIFGWQLHTTRAAISTLPKKVSGLAIRSEKVEGRGRVYHAA